LVEREQTTATAKTEADPYGMTNKNGNSNCTSNSNSNGNGNGNGKNIESQRQGLFQHPRERLSICFDIS
jgi:hypothetical protein